WAGKGVVHRRQHAGLLARGRNRADVHAAQRWIDGRFEPDDFGLWADGRSDIGELFDGNETMRDAEPGQEIVNDVKRTAVDRATTQNLVAALELRHQRRRNRRHPATEEEGRLRPVDRRQFLLDRDDRGVFVARIKI